MAPLKRHDQMWEAIAVLQSVIPTASDLLNTMQRQFDLFNSPLDSVDVLPDWVAVDRARVLDALSKLIERDIKSMCKAAEVLYDSIAAIQKDKTKGAE